MYPRIKLDKKSLAAIDVYRIYKKDGEYAGSIYHNEHKKWRIISDAIGIDSLAIDFNSCFSKLSENWNVYTYANR